MRKRRRLDSWLVLATFRPGEKGTKKLVRDWGQRLLCVRYRYNPVRRTRLKTIELVVAEAAWRKREEQEFSVAIRSWESALRNSIVAAGGKWDRGNGVWLLTRRKVVRLGLESRAKKVRAAAPPAHQRLLASHTSEANILGNPKANTYGNFRSPASKPRNLQ